MDVNAFDYPLDESLIAQYPLKDRSACRLMLVDRKNKSIKDKHFYDIIDYLKPGDVLVRNNTRVIPARLFGTKLDTGAKIEALLLHHIKGDVYECLIGNAKAVKKGTEIIFKDGLLTATCVEVLDEGLRHLDFHYEGIFLEVLEQVGETPLPPYIHQKKQEENAYQTVYAKVSGSAAAPTAGFHFDEQLFDAKNKNTEASQNIKNSYAEADKIISNAKKEAKKQSEVILNDTEEVLKAKKKQADADIEKAKQLAKEEIKKDAVEIAYLMSEKILEREVKREDDDRIINSLLGDDDK